MPRTRYAIALGSNRRSRYGGPGATLRAALASVERLGSVERVSRIVGTPAVGPAGRAFANAVAILATELPPDRLLEALKKVEREFGRRGGRRWGPRVLDLDIILWSEGPWAGPGPLIPHAEFRARRFVLQPLAAVAPHWRDPISGATVRQLLYRLVKDAPVDRVGARS